jgi:thiol-disulfide isomerase/thioredoxin
LIDKNPKSVTAQLLKSSLSVTAPEPPKKSDGTIDSSFQVKWYRQHFFDNFDLADDALVRMPKPVYSEKIDEYLDNLFTPQPDTIAKAVDWIIARAKPNKETYKFAVFALMRKFQEPKIMGLDAVYVHIYDKYVASGEMDFWMGASHKKNVKEYAERLRKSLIGKTGPNLIMQDENLKPKAMYNIKNKYTILYIYDPDCGHCRKETPKMVAFYEKNKAKFDLEVFAVCVDSSLVKMKKYMKEMNMQWVNVNGMRSYVGDYKDFYDAVTTPSLFILDSRKKIIGKKIAADDLEHFFINYEKYIKAHPPEKSGTSKGS